MEESVSTIRRHVLRLFYEQQNRTGRTTLNLGYLIKETGATPLLVKAAINGLVRRNRLHSAGNDDFHISREGEDYYELQLEKEADIARFESQLEDERSAREAERQERDQERDRERRSRNWAMALSLLAGFLLNIAKDLFLPSNPVQKVEIVAYPTENNEGNDDPKDVRKSQEANRDEPNGREEATEVHHEIPVGVGTLSTNKAVSPDSSAAR